MVKILVANTPAYFSEFPNRHWVQAGSRWSFSMDLPRGHSKEHYQPYPFDLGYLSSRLKNRGVDVVAFDACAHDLTDEEFKSYVREVEPDSLYVDVPTVSYPLMHRVLKEVSGEVGCRVIVYGSHVSARPQDFSWTKDFDVRRGVYPFEVYCVPDRESFPIADYHDFEFHKPTAQMLSSRGCPMNCSFCVQRHVAYGSNKYWTRNAESVVDEMILCIDEYGAEQVYFDDDTMTINLNHVKAVCDEILARELELPWTCMGDVTVDRETLALMRKAGCMGIKFGVDSVNPKTLQSIGKTFVNPERVKRFVEDSRDLGIWSHATYVIGLPFDHRQDIEDMISYSVNLGSDSVQFSIATPFPGTPFYKQCEDMGWLVKGRDWTYYDGARYSVTDYPYLHHTEIEELFQKAMRVRKQYGLSMRDKVG